MIHPSDTSSASDLTQLMRLARETHDQVKRVRARAHRLCGLLSNQRSEAAPSEQEDGWFYFAQGRDFMHRRAFPAPVQRLDRRPRRNFAFTRPPG